MDVVVGFDISTHENGQTLLEGQSWIETYLQDLLHTISSLNGVSCEVGTETQVSVAFQVTNAMEKYSPKFEIYSENILNSLKDVTVKGPSLLNANLLSSLWDAFQNKSAARGKVSWFYFLCWSVVTMTSFLLNFLFECFPRWFSYFQMDWMMTLKSLNKNLMNLEKKVLSMGKSGKGVFTEFITSELNAGS